MSQTKAQLIDPTDGSIVNADINASAAIAGSKISPSFTANTTITAASPVLRLADSTDPVGTDGVVGKLEFYGSDGSSGGPDVRSFIQTISTNSSGNAHALVIGLGESNNAPTEKVRILGDGKVGIGVTSPSSKLHINCGSDNTAVQINSTDAGSFYQAIDNTGESVFGHSGANAIISVDPGASVSSSAIVFQVDGNSEKMRIDSSGNMLLGLTSTSFPKRLNVQGSSGAIIALKNNDTTSYAANTNTSIEFGLNTGNTGNQNGSCEIRAFKENGTNGNNARGLSFYTGANGGSPTERLRIESNGFVSRTYKPVKTIVNTNQDSTTGQRFVISLPNTSRMFKIAGTFSFSGNGSGIIFADFGDWSDGHTVDVEGVALSFRNGASEDLDDLGNTRFQRMTPAAFDAYNLEIQYEIFITSQAFQNGNDTGNNAGGGRPGAFGHIRFTHSQIGVALTTFTFQDINATGTDRLQSFAWDIDGSTGNLGSGEHTYVLEEYPLT